MEARLCTVVIGMSHFAPRLGIFILNYVALKGLPGDIVT